MFAWLLCRQLLASASDAQLRSVHRALQTGLGEAMDAAAALPVLEATLLALEGASGGRGAKGLASQVPYNDVWLRTPD